MGSWLPGDALPDIRARLYLLPHAGGSASAFASWRSLTNRIDVRPVQYPGRGNRLRERPAASIDALADGIADAVLKDAPDCCALFGHSMGGTVALEVAHRLLVSGIDMRHLIVSASLPPRALTAKAPRSGLPAPDLLAELRDLGGINEELLGHPGLAEIVLGAFRSDLAAVERFRPPARPPLMCPITAFTGADDPGVTPDEASGWRRLTSAGFDLRSFPGGHFYLWDARADVVRHAEALLLHGSPPGAAPLHRHCTQGERDTE